MGRPLSSTIASGTAVSSEAILSSHLSLIGLYVPAMAATTDHLKLQRTLDGSTFVDVVGTDGAILTFKVSTSAATYIAIDPDLVPLPQYFRLVSCTNVPANVNQDADKVIYLFWVDKYH